MFLADVIVSLFVLMFIFTPVVLLAALVFGRAHKKTPSFAKQEQCEQRVTASLRTLDMKSYVVFDNLIIPSQGNTSHTEIDQVVVSPFGIFCIETKSHHGSIYGFTNSKTWKQYLGNKCFDIHNPLHQNYKHVKALEELLGSDIKRKIHSYVVYPNAYSVKIDGKLVDCSIRETLRKIERHKNPVYTLQECTTLLKALVYASSHREELKELHIQEVRAYLKTKTS